MADEQPNTLSADVPASDAPTPAAGSDQPTEESSESPSWWQRITRRQPRGRETDQNGEDQQATGGQASKALTVTEEELQRRVQAETDRREARRQQDLKVQKRRELRDKDPFAYAEQDRQEEEHGQATGQLTQFLANIGTEHDRASIDPVIEVLPKAERERILALEGAGRGLDGRKLVVTEALKALEKHWKSEGEKVAEAKLRRNPAFRKQILAESRGSVVEPELLPAMGPSAADQTVSSLLRRYYDLPGPRNHNESG